MKKLYIIFAFFLISIMIVGASSVFAPTKAQTEEVTATLRGDANCNGKITASDAGAVLRHVVGLSQLSPQGIINADVNLDEEVTAGDAAIILRHVVGLINIFDPNWDPKDEPTNTPEPTPSPTQTPKPTKTPKPTATPKPTPVVWVCAYCGTVFGPTDADYEDWYYHAWYEPGCYKYGRDMVHDENPTPTPIPGHNGHWEEIWVVDVPAVYHTVWVCNICKWESDDWGAFSEHQIQHLDAGEGSGYHQYTVCDQEEQGHWETVWVPDP